jgi:hypothetical protein
LAADSIGQQNLQKLLNRGSQQIGKDIPSLLAIALAWSMLPVCALSTSSS